VSAFLHPQFELPFSKACHRLSYDAATTKFEKLKGSKKDKERREVEDEMEKARDR